VGGSVYAEALLKAQARQAETGALAIHGYDDPLVIAGQGTVGVELHEQAGDLDVVLVAVGGGGLASGIAAYYGSDVQVVAVETEHTNAYAAAAAAGRPVAVDHVGGPAADSLGASSIGVLAFDILRTNQVPSVLVSGGWILTTQQMLWTDFHLVVEHGGAAALAAVLSGAYVRDESRKIGVVVCGSNTDPLGVIA
jgi:threonine dehydratase